MFSYRRGKNGKTDVFLFCSFVHEPARGATCAFTLNTVNTLIKTSSRDDKTFHLDTNQPTANRLRVGQGQ